MDKVKKVSKICDKIIELAKLALEEMISYDDLPVVVLLTFEPDESGGAMSRLTMHGGERAEALVDEQKAITRTMTPVFKRDRPTQSN